MRDAPDCTLEGLLVDLVMEYGENGLEVKAANDDDADDGMPIAISGDLQYMSLPCMSTVKGMAYLIYWIYGDIYTQSETGQSKRIRQGLNCCMNPDQAAERSHPNQDSTKREQKPKGEAHDGPVRYDCVMVNTGDCLHHATSFLLRADYMCYTRSAITTDWFVVRCTKAKHQERSCRPHFELLGRAQVSLSMRKEV